MEEMQVDAGALFPQHCTCYILIPSHQYSDLLTSKLSEKWWNVLAPHRGSSPKGRGGCVAVLPESVGISIISDYSTQYTIPLSCPHCLRHFPRRGKQVVATLILIAFVCRLQVFLIEIRNTKRLGDISASVLHTASLLSAPLGHLPIGKADDTRIAPAKDHRSTHFHFLKSNNQKHFSTLLT